RCVLGVLAEEPEGSARRVEAGEGAVERSSARQRGLNTLASKCRPHKRPIYPSSAHRPDRWEPFLARRRHTTIQLAVKGHADLHRCAATTRTNAIVISIKRRAHAGFSPGRDRPSRYSTRLL